MSIAESNTNVEFPCMGIRGETRYYNMRYDRPQKIKIRHERDATIDGVPTCSFALIDVRDPSVVLGDGPQLEFEDTAPRVGDQGDHSSSEFDIVKESLMAWHKSIKASRAGQSNATRELFRGQTVISYRVRVDDTVVARQETIEVTYRTGKESHRKSKLKKASANSTPSNDQSIDQSTEQLVNESNDQPDSSAVDQDDNLPTPFVVDVSVKIEGDTPLPSSRKKRGPYRKRKITVIEELESSTDVPPPPQIKITKRGPYRKRIKSSASDKESDQSIDQSTIDDDDMLLSDINYESGIASFNQLILAAASAASACASASRISSVAMYPSSSASSYQPVFGSLMSNNHPVSQSVTQDDNHLAPRLDQVRQIVVRGVIARITERHLKQLEGVAVSSRN